MLKTDIVVLKDLQHLAAKTDLRVHHVLVDRNRAEALLARNAGNRVARLSAGGTHNHGAAVLGTVGVPDVDRNALLPHRENRILMHDTRTHIGELAEFLVGDGLNDGRVFDNVRIRAEEARDIRPVLIEICVDGARNDRARDIRAAAAKGRNAAVLLSAVEARNHRAVIAGKLCRDLTLRFLRVKAAVVVEKYHIRRIHKGEAEVSRHHMTVQIFAATRRIFSAAMCAEILFQFGKFRAEIQIQRESVDNLLIAPFDFLQRLLKERLIFRAVVELIEEIGDLCVAAVALAGRARHDITPRRIAPDNLTDLLKLLRTGEGTTAKFYYLLHALLLSLLICFLWDGELTRENTLRLQQRCPDPGGAEYSC